MAKAKTADPGAAEWDEIAIGDQVKHPTWGVGTVLFRSGVGDDAKAIVVFPEEGQKKLMLKYAKLKKIGSAPRSEQAKIKATAVEKPAPLPRKKVEDLEEDEGDEDDVSVPEDDELLLDEDDTDFFDDDEEDQFRSKDEGDDD